MSHSRRLLLKTETVTLFSSATRQQCKQLRQQLGWILYRGCYKKCSQL